MNYLGIINKGEAIILNQYQLSLYKENLSPKKPYQDGPIQTQATFGQIGDIAFAPNGDLYIIDYEFEKIRKMTPDGQVSTIFTPNYNLFENIIKLFYQITYFTKQNSVLLLWPEGVYKVDRNGYFSQIVDGTVIDPETLAVLEGNRPILEGLSLSVSPAGEIYVATSFRQIKRFRLD